MLKGDRIVLREKLLEDAAADYAWRCDAELAKLDANSPLIISYKEYLFKYAEELYAGNLRCWRFAVETIDGEHIGNCSCVDIDGVSAEIGIMIGNRFYWDKGYGSEAIRILVDYIFRESKLSHIYLKTLDWNLRAQKCFEKCGFVVCGHSFRVEHNFVLMELYRSKWEKQGVANNRLSL